MRVRSRASGGQMLPYKGFKFRRTTALPFDPWVNAGNPMPLFSPYFSERIEDEGGKYSPGTVKACSHTKIQTEFFSVPTPAGPHLGYARNWDPDYWIITNGGSGTWLGNNVDATQMISGIPIRTFSSDAASFVSSVGRRFSRHIPTEVSVPNFLLEMGDIPGSISSLTKLRRYNAPTVKDLRNKVSDRRINLGGTVADHWLNWNFGILPTIRDLQGFMGIHDKVTSRVEFLKRTRRKQVRVRDSKTFVSTATRGWQDAGDFTAAQWMTSLYKLMDSFFVRRTHTVSCGGYMYHDITDLDDVNKRYLSYLAAAGFTSPLAVIWEAIPYSFIADYFTNIGDLVSDFENIPIFNGNISLSQAWTNHKIVTEVWRYVRVIPGKGNYSEGLVQYTKKTEFTRSKGLATSKGLQLSTTLNGSQIANMLALLA